MADELGAHYINYKKDPFFSKMDFNWLKDGQHRIVPVRNQQRCSACYSFTVADCISSCYYGTKNELHILSGQDCVDCSHHSEDAKPDRMGCFPGTLTKAFTYARDSGLRLNEHYPYVGEKRNCQAADDLEVKIQIEGFHKDVELELKATAIEKGINVATAVEEGINSFIQDHPIAASIQMFNSFKRLGGEIYEGPDPSEKSYGRHALLIVGYGMTQEGVKYFLVKNSWGIRWGYHGYGKVRRDLLSGFSYPYNPSMSVGDKMPVEHEKKNIKKSRKRATKATKSYQRNFV